MNGKWMLLISCLLLLASAAQAADPSLIGWWPLDEESGETAADISGRGNNGTLSENVSWAPDGGRWGGAALYDGADTAYIEISAANISASAGTIMVWAYLSEPQPSHATQYFFGHTTQPSYANRIQLYMDGSETGLDMGLGGAHAVDTDIVTLSTETWLHIAMTWDNGSYAIYLDGDSVATGSYSGLTEIHDIAHIGNDGNPTSQGTEAFSGMLDEARWYDRSLSPEEIQVAMHTVAAFGIASSPVPAKDAVDVPRDVTLSWTPGEMAVAHDVYFGTAFEDVNAAGRADSMDVLISEGQNGTTYQMTDLLAFGQTYYWRIDEVNGSPDNTIFKGDIWSFTTEPLAYAIENIIATSSAPSGPGTGPEKTVDGSGIDELDQHSTENTDMWLTDTGAVTPIWLQYEFDRAYKLHELKVWNYNIIFELALGFGLKDVTIEHSTDGAEWTVLGDIQFAQAAARADYTANTTIDLGGVMARYVRLKIDSGWGPMDQFGLSEVRFLHIPAFARDPQPSDGDTSVAPDAMLTWRAGREAASHEIYLSTDEAAVVDGTALVNTATETSYTPGNLDFGAAYFWKIDEVNSIEEINVWEGNLWTFSTQEYAVIDNMESYTDDEGSRIYEAWIDGYNIDENGSQVGYLGAPFAETIIVNSGSQSMPLFYENLGAATVSEAGMDLGGMDLDTNGADTLRLFVSGSTPAFIETPDGNVLMNGIGEDIWGAADEFRYVYKQLTGNGSLTVRVDDLDESSDAWVKAGVMIRQGVEAGAVNAFMAMTGGEGGGATFQQRLEADGDTVSQNTYDGNPFAPPYWVRIDRAGNTVSAFISPDGQSWQQASETVTIQMDDPVLIGLAVTSHNVDQATMAEFSNISFTGNVGNNWQVGEIGVTQPAEGNDPLPLYVAIEDTSGSLAVAVNPDTSATSRSGWTEWLIPYSELSGVNLNSVRTLFIGVGDPSGTASTGSGLIFIDDVGFGHPAPTDE